MSLSCRGTAAFVHIPRPGPVQGRHDYTTLDFSFDAKGRFRSASIYYLDDRLYDPEKYAFFSPSNRERVLSFCQDFPEQDPIQRLDSLQQHIRETRAYRQMLKKQEKIRKAMQVPPLPKGIPQWARKNILPAYLFYDSERGKKSVLCRCSSCGKRSAFSKSVIICRLSVHTAAGTPWLKPEAFQAAV